MKYDVYSVDFSIFKFCINICNLQLIIENTIILLYKFQ